jgi:tetratricopeptide (TPR) repeat protein
MNGEDYFSKKNTGGADASTGFDYQDLCVLLYLLKNLDVRQFKSIGIETDDDFSLIYDNEKILYQVKYEELSIYQAKQYVSHNRVLIAPSKNKSLSTLLRCLDYYRNNQSSCEDIQNKLSVKESFKKVLTRNDLNLAGLKDFPDTWFVEIIPEDRIIEVIKLIILEWGISKGLILDPLMCFIELYYFVCQCRKDRNYLGIKDAVNIFYRHSKKLVCESNNSDPLNFLKSLKVDKNKVLNSIDYKISHAESLLSQNKYEDAYQEYLELSNVVQSEKIHIKCAGILQVLGEIDDAIFHCDEALKIESNSYEAFVVKGTLFAGKGENDFALELLKSAEFRKGDSPFVLYNIGVAYLNLKNTDEAIKYFKKTISIDFNLSHPHLNLGVCLFNKGDFSESLKHIDLALRIEPGLAEALSQKGEIKRFYGELDEAIKLYERCLLKAPDNQLAELGLALSLIGKGEPLGFGLLVKKFSDELSKLEVNKSLVIINVGWERTIGISIKNLNGFSYSVECDGVEVYVPKAGNDKIGIGTICVEGATLPIIFKQYEDLNAYINAVNAIKLSPISDFFVPVNGLIEGKGDHCEIQINFEHYSIYGKTNRSKNIGFNGFSDSYDDYALLMLSHEETNQKEQFTLLGLKCN